MKFGVSSYSFVKKLNSGEMTLFDAIDFAKGAGYDAMDFADFAPVELAEPDFAKRVHEKCIEVGIIPSCYAVCGDLVRPDGRSVEEEIARVKHHVDIAEILGCNKMRFDTTKYYPEDGSCKSFRDVADRIAPIIREISEYARTKGILTLSENHYQFFQDSERMDYLMEQVHCDNHKLLIDVGNFLCADENPIHAVGRLSQYAGHVHVKDFLFRNGDSISPFAIWGKPDESVEHNKDGKIMPAFSKKGADGIPYGGGWLKTRGNNFIRGTVLGNGIVPIHQCLDLIHSAGYDDVIALEFEGLEEPLDAVRLGLKYMQHFCGQYR